MVTGEVVDIYSTKQIHELTQLNKLQGKEEMLIDNGEVTLRVTVDTLLGYIRDEINTAVTGEQSGESGSPINAGTVIHFIDEGDPDIPKESRIKGHYYIKVIKGQEAHLSTGLPRFIESKYGS